MLTGTGEPRAGGNVTSQPPSGIALRPGQPEPALEPSPLPPLSAAERLNLNRLRELGTRVLPAPDEPDVVRFADDNGIEVELTSAR